MLTKNIIGVLILGVVAGCSWPGDNTDRGGRSIPITRPQMSVATEVDQPASVARTPAVVPSPTSKTAVTVAEIPAMPAPLDESPERPVVTSTSMPATAPLASEVKIAAETPPNPSRETRPQPDPRLAPRGSQSNQAGDEPVSLNELVPGIKPAAPEPAAPNSQPPRDRDDTQTSSRPIGADLVANSVLQVNNQYITVDGIVRSSSEKLADISKGLSEERFRQRAAEIITEEIRRQISELLVMTEASSRIGDEQKKKIEEEVAHAQSSLITQLGNGSKKKLEQLLLEQGTSLETVLNDHRRRLTVRMFLHEKFMPSIKVNRQLLWEYYTKHTSEFTQIGKVQMQIIAAPNRDFLPKDAVRPSDLELKDATRSAREWIEKAQAELKAGTEFGKVAIMYSKDSKAADGGVWPMMSKGSFREEKVEAAAFALPAGGVSGIIETPTGFYIVKAKEVQQPKTTSFEDAQPKIEEALRTQQEREMTTAFFDKLMANSTIIEYAKFVELAVDRATVKFFKK